MAITSSAKKAQRVAERRAVYNARRKKTLKETVKEMEKLVAGKKKAEAEKLLPKAYEAIDKAVKGKVMTAGAAAREKSRIVKRIRAIA